MHRLSLVTVSFAVAHSPSVSASPWDHDRERPWGKEARQHDAAALPSTARRGIATRVRARRWSLRARRLSKRGSANPPARWNQPAISIAMRQMRRAARVSIPSKDALPLSKGEVRLRSGLSNEHHEKGTELLNEYNTAKEQA